MSRNNSSSNLRKDSSTPNSLVEFPQLREGNNPPTTSTPGIPSRDSSPAIPPSQAGPKNRRVSSAKDVRREGSPSPARSISSTSIARLANSAASQSSPAVVQSSNSTSSGQPAAINTEQQQPLSPRPQRPINPNVPHWPTSPRLSLSRSPPPTIRSPSITSPRKPLDSNLALPPPSMAVRDKESPGKGKTGDEMNDGQSYFHHHTTQRPPRPIASPAPLETVTESSLPSTPAIGMGIGDKSIDARLTEAEQRRQETSSMSTRPSESSISSRTAPESESDTGNLSDRKPPSRAPSRQISRRPTINNVSGKGQDASGDVRAEIETVTSIPQQINHPGTVRLQKKTSQETIRPPKEKKKKQKRTAPGPNAQKKKADHFEQIINDTLDDAESSDSEETFVYESNPPDKVRPRHSRASSVTSLSDPRRQLLDNAQGKTKKMKFGTNHGYKRDAPYDDYTSDTPGSSTIRAANQPGLRSHIGRGYTNPNLDESGAPQTVRHANHKGSHQSLRAPHPPGSRASSRPGSPRVKHAGGHGTFTTPHTRRETSKLSLYEGDIEGDIDERTPFFQLQQRGGVHSKSRPSSMSRRQLEYNYNRQRNWYARIACCVFAVFVMMGLVSFALGFVFLTTKPLVDVRLLNITDVIATTQEMMFNLDVGALNPNILPVTISTMDVNVFIKSPYVKDEPKKGKHGKEKPGDDDGDDGDDGDGWFKKLVSGQIGTTAERRKRNGKSAHALDGIDEGTDPIEDPEEETMLLGRIFNFDSALVFDGSPFRQVPTHALGEVRLSKPGNKTETGGSERWERAMLHKFDLTVRGFLRYQLPLSGRVRTATVQGTVTVHPDDEPEDGFRDHIGLTIGFHNEEDDN